MTTAQKGIDIQIQGTDPDGLAELIDSTLYGHSEPESAVGCTGKLVREQQEDAERKRPSRAEMQTVNFALIDDENDWTDI